MGSAFLPVEALPASMLPSNPFHQLHEMFLLAEEPAQQIQKAERHAESMKAVAEDADVSYSLPDVVSMKEAAQQVKPGLSMICGPMQCLGVRDALI